MCCRLVAVFPIGMATNLGFYLEQHFKMSMMISKQLDLQHNIMCIVIKNLAGFYQSFLFHL